MSELKPCPFCGSKARLFVGYDGVCVMCTAAFSKDCGCQTSWYDDASSVCGTNGWRKNSKTAVDRAIEAWNRRAGEQDDSI